jgi:Tfp pilus assembly protein PilF
MADRIDQLKEFLANDPSDSFIRYALAQEYLKRGQMYQAKEAFETLQSDDPSYVGLYYHLGKLYEELDQGEQAIATYEAGIQVAKKATDFHALSELNTAKVNLEMEML